MGIASDNAFPYVRLVEGTTPANPPADSHRLFVRASDQLLCYVDSTGTVREAGSPIDDIVDLPTAETDDTLVLAPDGAGGVEFRAEAGGGGGVSLTTLGYDTIGGSTENVTTDRQYMKKVTLSEAGMLASIGAYINQSTDFVQAMMVSVLSDSGGLPDKVLAYSASPQNSLLLETSGTPTYAASWVHTPIGVWLPAGDYWIGVMFLNGGTLQLYYDGSGSDRYYTSGGYWVSHHGRYSETDSTRHYSIRAHFLGASGSGSSFPTAPTLVESVAWTAKNDGQTLALANTPNTGDVILVFQVSNAYASKLPTGGGVTTWYCLGNVSINVGNVLASTIWMGVVDGTPSATITLHWTGNNSQYAALANFRGLQGRVESSVMARDTYYNATSDAYVSAQTTTRSPLAIAYGSGRAGTGVTSGGFTDMRTAGNNGWQNAAYKFLTEGENVAPYWTGNGTDNTACMCALIY